MDQPRVMLVHVFWFWFVLVSVYNTELVASENEASTFYHNMTFLKMTGENGNRVADKTASMTVGPVGPLVLLDTTLLEELSHLTRERIPERVSHPKGTGAFGYFTVTDGGFGQLCKAAMFDTVGKRTNVFVRFSTGDYGASSCDTVRGTRGASVKFYTEEGNLDLVGSNSPVFLVRDPMLAASALHVLRRHPTSNLLDPDMFWDFMTQRPETTHQLLLTFSDRGTPDGYRHMNFYGTHAFKLVNKAGVPCYCKFHFKSNQGAKNMAAEEAVRMCGVDPDYATRDLYNNIRNLNYPSWTLYFQMMSFKQATEFPWNPFDVTKVWPRPQFPLYEIGKLVLDRNPTNHFAEVEQVAFSPSHLVPGIEASPDKVLQARMFAYPDAHRYRLGVNYHQLPVNSPYLVTVTNTQRDGRMSFNNQAGVPHYFPSSVFGGPRVSPDAANVRWAVTGDVSRYNTDNDDNYGQVTTFWKQVLDGPQRERLVVNLVGHLRNASEILQKRAVAMLKNVSQNLATRVQQGLLQSTIN